LRLEIALYTFSVLLFQFSSTTFSFTGLHEGF
jgi:hypothetical protein